MNGPTIITRDQWGAQPPRGQLTRMSSYDGIVVHHSAGAEALTLEDGQKAVRAIQRLHQDGRGWVDIGYNFLIDGAGDIFEGRGQVDRDLARGAHAPGVNSTRVGISLLGCFHPPAANCSQVPTDSQLQSLVHLCQHLILRYWIQPARITGHRNHRQTACPGDTLFARLQEIRERVGGRVTIELDPPLGA